MQTGGGGGVIPFDLCKMNLLCFPDIHTSALARKAERRKEPGAGKNEDSVILFSQEGPSLILQTPVEYFKRKFASSEIQLAFVFFPNRWQKHTYRTTRKLREKGLSVPKPMLYRGWRGEPWSFCDRDTGDLTA